MKNKVLLELYMVRHGQSKMNAAKEADPSTSELDRVDPVLTDLGERQAELLGKRLSAVSFDAIISSPLRRAVQTAVAVAKHQPETRYVRIEPIFTERGVPEGFKGLSFFELNDTYGCLTAAPSVQHLETAALVNDDGDDSYQALRAKEALCGLRSRYNRGEKVLVVFHAAFETDVILEALGIASPAAFDPELGNTSITRIVFHEQGTGSYGYDVKLMCLNDTAHLYNVL